jgi:hypothetical protein
MKKFTYTNPVPCAVSLIGGIDVHMHQGNEYELPADNGYVKRLVAQGYLVEVPAPAPSPVTKNEKK